MIIAAIIHKYMLSLLIFLIDMGKFSSAAKDLVRKLNDRYQDSIDEKIKIRFFEDEGSNCLYVCKQSLVICHWHLIDKQKRGSCRFIRMPRIPQKFYFRLDLVELS
jgi:hypothetical protein